MTNRQFRALLNLFMCSDPWPVEGEFWEEERDEIEELLNQEAQKRGFESWVGAYNGCKP